MSDIFDLDDFDDNKAATGGELSNVVRVVEKMKTLQKEIEDAEESLKAKKRALAFIEQNEIPDLMTQIGLQEITVAEGEKLKIEKFINASIPSNSQILDADDEEKPELMKRQKEAVKFLREHSAQSLIKNRLEIEFSAGQDNMVGDLIGKCNEHGLPYRRDEAVHKSTLQKWIKEQLDAGVQVPKEPFALFVGQKAVLKSPKQSKKSMKGKNHDQAS